MILTSIMLPVAKSTTTLARRFSGESFCDEVARPSRVLDSDRFVSCLYTPGKSNRPKDWFARESTVTTILVVDDDQAILRLTSVILRADKHAVETESEAEQALHRLEAFSPELIILDLNMPEVDGRTFYRRARAIGYAGPVVVCSAYGAAAAQRELGAEAALDKPFTPDQLSAIVSRLLAT